LLRERSEASSVLGLRGRGQTVEEGLDCRRRIELGKGRPLAGEPLGFGLQVAAHLILSGRQSGGEAQRRWHVGNRILGVDVELRAARVEDGNGVEADVRRIRKAQLLRAQLAGRQELDVRRRGCRWR
jgi:hypothetical protein